MAKTKAEKKQIVESYVKGLQKSKGIVLVKSSKVTPNELSELRKELFDFDSEFHIVKNTLLKIALKEESLDEQPSLEYGNHAVMFFGEDIVTPSKILKKFIENNKDSDKKEKLEVVGGYLDGKILTLGQVQELAEMPAKEESIAMILGIIDSAISGVLNVLEDAPRSIASIAEQAFKE